MSRTGPARTYAALAAAMLLCAAALILGAGARREAPERLPEDEGHEPAMNPAGLSHERWMQRVGPDGRAPVELLLEARERLTAAANDKDAGLWNWEWLGPGNIGGRIRAILCHPTISGRIFIGSTSGGIWRTDDSGQHWAAVNDFLPNLAVTSLVMDPTNSNVIYAGTGEPYFGNTDYWGAGIFKSTDGGVTWSQLSSTANNDFLAIGRLAHHPTLASTLWATCSPVNKIDKTTDGGTSWNTVLTTNAPPVDVKIRADNANWILVGCQRASGGNGAVYLTTDGGTNWPEQTVGGSKLPDDTGRCEVAFGPGGVMYACLDRNGGEVYRSTDGGVSWGFRSAINLGGQGGYDNVLWVDPTNNQFVVAGGVGLFRSTNAGASFYQINRAAYYRFGLSAHADQHIVVPHPGYNGTTNRTVYVGNDGGIQRAANIATVDTTSGWSNLATGLGITQFYRGAAAADGSVYVGAAQDNSMPRRPGGGGADNWTMPAAPGDGTWAAIKPSDPQIVYGEYVKLQLVKSTDGGFTYWLADSGLSDSGTDSSLFVAPAALDPNNSSIVWGGSNRIWKSTDEAGSWTMKRSRRTGGPKCSAIGVKPGNSQEVWIGYTNGLVSRTTDGGTTWVDLDANSPGLPDRWVTDIAVSPYFSGEAVVVFAGYQTNSVWMTFNGGTTWTQRTGTAPADLPALQVNTVTYHPTDPDWIYIGTDLGVFASEDFGLHWNVTPHYPDQDGPANVEVDDLFWTGDYLVAATHGRGMWRARPKPTIFVNLANSGSEDGSAAHPYNTVLEGISASGNGTNLSVQAGTYTEGSLLFDRRGLVTTTGGATLIH